MSAATIGHDPITRISALRAPLTDPLDRTAVRTERAERADAYGTLLARPDEAVERLRRRRNRRIGSDRVRTVERLDARGRTKKKFPEAACSVS